MNPRIAILMFLGMCTSAQACTPVQAQIDAVLSGGQLFFPIADVACVIGIATLRAGARMDLGNTEFNIGEGQPDDTIKTKGWLVSQGSISGSGVVTNFDTVGIGSDGDTFQALVLYADSFWYNGPQSRMENYAGILSYGRFTLGRIFINAGRFESLGQLGNDGGQYFLNTGYLIAAGKLNISGTLENYGDIQLRNQHVFDTGGVGDNASSGTIRLWNNSRLIVDPGASLTVGGNRGFELASQTLLPSGEPGPGSGQIVNEGTLTVGRGGRVYVKTLTDIGSTSSFVQIADGGILHAVTLVLAGQIANAGDLSIGQQFADSIVNGSIVNSGTLTLAARSFAGTGSLVQTSGITRVGSYFADGNVSLAVIDIQAGRLCGFGTVTATTGPFTGGVGATLCPGASPGALTIGGDLALTGSTIEIEIAGTAAGSYDTLTVNGMAKFTGGKVKVIFIDGFTPQLGDSWQFLVLNGGASGLGSLTMLYEGLPSGFAFNSVFGEGGATLSTTAIAAVPEPGTWALMFAGIALLGIRRRKYARD